MSEFNAKTVGSIDCEPVTASIPGPSDDNPVEIFISYSHADEQFRSRLVTHLATLKRQHEITAWHDQCIEPGENWSDEIDAAIDRARIILLLVSANFLASDYCYEKEAKRAMERHRTGEAQVIPIILTICGWKHTPLADLQALPQGGRPISSWTNPEAAYNDIIEGIRKVLHKRPNLLQVSTRGTADLEVRVRVYIRIEASLEDIDGKKLDQLLNSLKNTTNDYTISITSVEVGSVIIGLEMTPEAYAILVALEA
jgi:hypothetical protein